ncbi:hypothetical protein TRVL_09962 [Trypanosoma vivax]|nr:hypothetical protein TRVL_09962 [Trypanosoma vivax]
MGRDRRETWCALFGAGDGGERVGGAEEEHVGRIKHADLEERIVLDRVADTLGGDSGAKRHARTLGTSAAEEGTTHTSRRGRKHGRGQTGRGQWVGSDDEQGPFGLGLWPHGKPLVVGDRDEPAERRMHCGQCWGMHV